MNSHDRLSTVKKQTYEAEIKKLIFFANSSPEAIVHLVQRHCLLTCKHTRSLCRILRQREHAKIRPEWISQSNWSIGRPLGFLIDRLNTSASLYRIAPCLRWNKGDRGQILEHHCHKSRHVLAQNSQKWSGNGDNIKIKRKVSPFLLPLPFIFLSLPLFLYFLPIYMAWRLAKRWVKSRWNKGDGAKFFITIFINPDISAFRQVTFGIQKLKKLKFYNFILYCYNLSC